MNNLKYFPSQSIQNALSTMKYENPQFNTLKKENHKNFQCTVAWVSKWEAKILLPF